MIDPVMSIVLRAGSLTLAELLTRVGENLTTRRRLASLLKSGDVTVETVHDAQAADLPSDLVIEPSLSEEEIVTRLNSITQQHIAETVEISPTAKAWRSSGS